MPGAAAASPQAADPATIAREIETVARLGARHVLLGEADYPALLAELDTAPPALIVRGDIALARRGGGGAGRCAQRLGRVVPLCARLAQDLAAQNVPVTSGLARGIDTAAHIGALDGGTIGVIASGIDIAFPPETPACRKRWRRAAC